MAKYETKPSLSKATRLKKMSQAGELALDEIDRILAEEKKPPKGNPASSIRFSKYFLPGYTQEQMDAVIVELLKNWKSGVAA